MQTQKPDNETCLRTRACIMSARSIAMSQERQLLMLLLASQCPSPAAGNCRAPSCRVQTCQSAPAHGQQKTHPANVSVSARKHARERVFKQPAMLRMQYFAEATACPHTSTHPRHPQTAHLERLQRHPRHVGQQPPWLRGHGVAGRLHNCRVVVGSVAELDLHKEALGRIDSRLQ